MTSSVTNYIIYCVDEQNFISGWGTEPPTKCYNNSTHEVDINQISVNETVINMNTSIIKTINNFQIYCITEGKYVEGWSENSPTVCYSNNTHDVNLNSVQLLDSISNTEMKIKEDSVNVSRNVKVISIVFNNVEANTTQHQYYTFSIPTSMYSYFWVSDDTNKGDKISIGINPDSPMGLILQDVSIGYTSLYAPVPVLLYGSVGFNIAITDGTNYQDLGEILTIDKINGVVTFQNALEYNFSSTNSLLTMTYYNMKDLEIGSPGRYPFGEDVIGGAAVPTGTVVRFSYKNEATTLDLIDEPKNFVIYMTLLF